MAQITRFFWRLCLLKETPLRIPNSTFVTLVVFSIYFTIALMLLFSTRSEQSILQIILTATIGISVQLGSTYLLLKFKNKGNLLMPVWSALLGTNALILIFLFPLNLVLLYAEDANILAVANSISLGCLGWWLAIAGFIYHKSAEVSMLQGSCIALLIELLSVITATSFSIS